MKKLNSRTISHNHFYELLTATVSHEMRTPLNSVTNLLVSLESYLKKDAAGLRLHRISNNSAKMLTFLVNDMLDLFQIKNGKLKKNQQVNNIHNQISMMLDILRIPCQEKGIDL